MGRLGEGVKWWWISFAHRRDPEVQGDVDRFLGVAIVQGAVFLEAASRTQRLKINPGGETVGYVVPEQYLPAMPDYMRNRLLTRAECDAIAEVMKAYD